MPRTPKISSNLAGSGKKKVTSKAAKAEVGEVVDLPTPVAATIVEPK